ncbi:serine/threonine-protein kinase pim-1-like [Neolamprologus brichardi]|uniref:serine/threonine-protein kinase pim-1-like n=1 Tax=Neolamprologus brichardi TaxID=32507 RepID=UPI001643B29E|nr:serine/threonine-protein kinase pim-1-like [Neolamprologus brichardi]
MKDGRRKPAGDSKEPPKRKKRDKTKHSAQNSAADQRPEFQARYVQEHHLGGGGCGAVFAGYRKTDHCPVAIKHIPKDRIPIKVTGENGKRLIRPTNSSEDWSDSNPLTCEETFCTASQLVDL